MKALLIGLSRGTCKQSKSNIPRAEIHHILLQEHKQKLFQLWQPGLAAESVAELELRKYLTISQVNPSWLIESVHES